MFALGPLRPLRGSRFALRQPDACRRGRMARDHETLSACRAAFRRLKGRGSALTRRSLGCFILQPRSLRGNDLRHAPRRPFGLRPTTSRSDTKTAFAVHENARFAGFTKNALGAYVVLHETAHYVGFTKNAWGAYVSAHEKRQPRRSQLAHCSTTALG